MSSGVPPIDSSISDPLRLEIEAVFAKIESLRTAEDPCEGATHEEVLSLERYAGCPLPSVYLSFLFRFGHSAGPLFVGSDFAIDGQLRLRLREYASELLVERKSPYRLKDSDFVFVMHQGYVFQFFDCEAGPNPPVYLFQEGRHDGQNPVKLHDSFLDCLRKWMSDLEAIRKRMAEYDTAN
jgi:hypothetical protein